MRTSKRYLVTLIVISVILVVSFAISIPCVGWDKCGACGDESIAMTLLSVDFILLVIVVLFIMAIHQIMSAYRALSTASLDV